MQNSTMMLLCCGLLFSCGGQNNNEEGVDGSKVIKEYNSEGITVSERSHRGDSVLHGASKFFYNDGNLKLLVEYRDGIKSGIEKGYYNSGKLKYSGYNKDGRSDSVCHWYYESGTLRSVDSWWEGILFGQQIKYSESGDLQEFFFNSIDGNTIYTRKYKPDGAYSEEGRVIYSIYNKLNLSLGEEIEIMYYPICPPNNEVRMRVEETTEDNKLLDVTSLTHSDMNKLYYALRYDYDIPMPTEMKKIVVNCYTELKEISSSKITRDTLSLIFTKK